MEDLFDSDDDEDFEPEGEKNGEMEHDQEDIGQEENDQEDSWT